MTFARVAELARRWARSDSGFASDLEVSDKIVEAVAELSRDVHGFPLKTYPALTPLFDHRTTYAVHLEASYTSTYESGAAVVYSLDQDVVLFSANADDQTGAQLATAIQTALQAVCGPGLTVAWTTYYLTITLDITGDGVGTPAFTSFEITSPESVAYADGTDAFFGGEVELEASGDDYVDTCAFPTGCTMRVDLTDAMSTIEAVWWDGYQLEQVDWAFARKGQAQGTPTCYAIRGQEMILYPTPTEQEEFYIEYLGTPTATDTDTNLPVAIPEGYQMAIPHLVASWLSDEIWEEAVSQKQYGLYRKVCGQYMTDYANGKSAGKVGTSAPPWYRVVP